MKMIPCEWVEQDAKHALVVRNTVIMTITVTQFYPLSIEEALDRAEKYLGVKEVE